MLPFVAGLAAGAVAVVAYNNNKKIRKTINKGAQKAKEYAKESYEKTKEFAGDVKESVGEKVECLKSKKGGENPPQNIEHNKVQENSENGK